MDIEQTNLGIEQVLGVLRRRAIWILLCLVLVTGAAYGFSKRETKKYTATASLVFNNNQLSQQVAGLPVASSNNQTGAGEHQLKLVAARRHGGEDGQPAWSGVDQGKGRRSPERERAGRIEHRGRCGYRHLATLAADIANTYTSGSSQSSRTATTPTTPPRSRSSTSSWRRFRPRKRPAPRGSRCRIAHSRSGCSPNCATATCRSRSPQRSRRRRPRRRPRETRSSGRAWPVAWLWPSRSCSSASTDGSGSRRIWRRYTACRCSASCRRALPCRALHGAEGVGSVH